MIMADEIVELCYAFERKVLSKHQMLSLQKSLITNHLKRVSADRSSQRCGALPISSRTDINVFVVDTGINKLTSLNLVGGFSATGSDHFTDTTGHGTHVAGIIGGYDQLTGITGIVPGVRLWSVKITDNTNSGLLNSLLKGLNWILQGKNTIWKGYGIVNVSLAGGSNQYIDDMMNKLAKEGIIVCASAGNFSGNANNYSPAHCKSVITVGATYQPDYNSFAIFSNHGSAVDILAPGSDIYSLYTTDNYSSMSGTSMACPIVTGTVALMLSSKQFTETGENLVKRIKTELIEASSSVLSKNYDNTMTENKRIAMHERLRAMGTPDVCVKAGCF